MNTFHSLNVHAIDNGSMNNTTKRHHAKIAKSCIYATIRHYISSSIFWFFGKKCVKFTNNGGKCPVEEKNPAHLSNSMTSRLSLKKRLSELYFPAF